MVRRSKSTLFLMEQLIVIAVFAICAAACVKILTASYFMAKSTRDGGNAILAAESAAECYKHTGGDIAKAAKLMGGTITSGEGGGTMAAGEGGGTMAVDVFYDASWQQCAEPSASYKLRITSRDPGRGDGDASTHLASGELSVAKTTGEELLRFTITAVNAQ